MGADFELLAAFLIDVRRAVHGELLDARRQRHRADHGRAGALGRRHDLLGGEIERAVIEGLEPDPNVLLHHRLKIPRSAQTQSPPSAQPVRVCVEESVASNGRSLRRLTGSQKTLAIRSFPLRALDPLVLGKLPRTLRTASKL